MKNKLNKIKKLNTLNKTFKKKSISASVKYFFLECDTTTYLGLHETQMR